MRRIDVFSSFRFLIYGVLFAFLWGCGVIVAWVVLALLCINGGRAFLVPSGSLHVLLPLCPFFDWMTFVGIVNWVCGLAFSLF